MADPELVALLKQGAERWNARDGAGEFRADLRGANLHGANLGRANLGRADLRRADLRRADLHGADLHGANLYRANLHGANLHGADLRRADLGGADLHGADLHGADLRRADLGGADLHGADLHGADLGGTVFGSVDLRGVIGLDAVLHRGPSIVGMDTLYKSEGQIPAVFLRGCGVPQVMIDYIPSLTVSSVLDFYSAFISHSHVDKAFATKLYGDLFNGQRIACWLDDHQILPGDRIMGEIDRGVRQADKLLLVCSEASLGASTWVDREVLRAFEKEERLHRERGERVNVLVPVLLDDYLFSDDCRYEWAADVRSRLAGDFRGWSSDPDVYQAALGKVVRAMRTDPWKKFQLPPPKL